MSRTKQKPMLTLQFRQEDLARLKYERYYHPVPKIRIRLHVVSLLEGGYSREEAARQAGVHLNSVKSYIRLYNGQGLGGLMQLHYKGAQSKLAPYRNTIQGSFEQEPPRSCKEAAARIEELSGISISAERARVFMQRLGMKCIKMGHVPAKADNEKQKRFLDTILEPLLQRAGQGQCHVFFMDAAHFTLAPFVCMVWCFSRLFVKAAAGRNRINVLGAIHATKGQLETLVNTTYITATEVVGMLKLLALSYSGLPIYVVLDNARYQHCKAVMQAAQSLGIELVFLPPYSPNLNLIERLWKFVRKKVLHARYFDTVDKFHAAIRQGIEKINTYQPWKPELESLLKPNFQLFA